MVKVVKRSKNVQQQRRPLFCALNDHVKKETMSFHVPGHKNGMNWPMDSAMKQMLPFDQTEVTGLDYLHEPEDVLKESQELLSSFYGSKKSYYLVNGSTVGNLAMVMGATSKGDWVLVDRTCHQSIIHALELAGVRPVFVTPAYQTEKREAVGVSLESIEAAFKKYLDIKAVILTYPSYNGQVFSLDKIAKYAHQRGAVVLVDEAHGAHFVLGDPFPKQALSLGADIVVQSAHKMLPAMTQTGYLHIHHETSATIQQKVEQYLHMLQSSSPSYVLMHSLEYARFFASQFDEEDLKATLAYRDDWMERFKQSGLVYLHSDDPLKVRLYWPGQSGNQLLSVLEELGMFPEKNDEDSVLLTFPLVKKDDQSLQRVETVKLPKTSSKILNDHSVHFNMEQFPLLSELAISYEQQQQLSIKKVQLDKAAGKIAARNIVPYPPGIPLVLKGEKCTKETIEQLTFYLEQNMRVVGINDQLEMDFFSNLQEID